jgi:glycosyltransferase involved in cell wall biosynthesis
MSDPLVSVIIPARNAGATVKKCLDSISSLRYDPLQVIVVDDGSDDGTGALLKDYPAVTLLATEGKGPSYSRNLALREAKGEFVAFTDADCIVDSGWIQELLKGFTAEKVAGVGGAQKSPQDETFFGSLVQEFLLTFGFISDYMQRGIRLAPTRHNPTCNTMYRRQILLELNGFLDGLWPGEDVELDYRIIKKGYSLMFNPAAVVFHYRPGSIERYRGMMFRYGNAQGFLVRRYGLFRLIHLVPAALLLFAVLFFLNPNIGSLLFLAALAALLLKVLLQTRHPLSMIRLLTITLFAWNLGFLYGAVRYRLKGRSA